jgi:hypothetical protein
MRIKPYPAVSGTTITRGRLVSPGGDRFAPCELSTRAGKLEDKPEAQLTLETQTGARAWREDLIAGRWQGF